MLVPLLFACASPPTPSTPPEPEHVQTREPAAEPTPEDPPADGDPQAASPADGRFPEIHAAHRACQEADPTQTGLNLCGVATVKRWNEKIAELHARLGKQHPKLDLTSAWAAHRDAEIAWLNAVYDRQGSMWPMVHAMHLSAFLEDRATELAYDLCDPRPVYAPAEDCYSDAIGEYDAFVLCDEAAYDADLNAAYKALTAPADKEIADLLRTSQRLWLAHRDVDTPVCSKMTQNPARELRVRHRVEQLRRYVEAAENGG